MTELEVVWNGSHGNTDRDLLCTFPAGVQVRDTEAAQRVPARGWRSQPKHDRTAEREAILALLATRPRWRRCVLRDALKIETWVFDGVMQRLLDKGLVRSIAFGTVALVRRKETAA